jgi:hypothetical protein
VALESGFDGLSVELNVLPSKCRSCRLPHSAGRSACEPGRPAEAPGRRHRYRGPFGLIESFDRRLLISCMKPTTFAEVGQEYPIAIEFQKWSVVDQVALASPGSISSDSLKIQLQESTVTAQIMRKGARLSRVARHLRLPQPHEMISRGVYHSQYFKTRRWRQVKFQPPAV